MSENLSVGITLFLQILGEHICIVVWSENSVFQAWKIGFQLDTLPLQLIPETFFFKSQPTFLIQKPLKNIYSSFDYLFYKLHSLIRQGSNFIVLLLYKLMIWDVRYLIVIFWTTMVKCQKSETSTFNQFSNTYIGQIVCRRETASKSF